MSDELSKHSIAGMRTIRVGGGVYIRLEDVLYMIDRHADSFKLRELTWLSESIKKLFGVPTK